MGHGKFLSQCLVYLECLISVSYYGLVQLCASIMKRNFKEISWIFGFLPQKEKPRYLGIARFLKLSFHHTTALCEIFCMCQCLYEMIKTSIPSISFILISFSFLPPWMGLFIALHFPDHSCSLLYSCYSPKLHSFIPPLRLSLKAQQPYHFLQKSTHDCALLFPRAHTTLGETTALYVRLVSSAFI